MFRSKSGDEGTEDPDKVDVQELQDETTGEYWLMITWFGDTYEDAWMNAPKRDVSDLEDTR